MTQKLSLLPPRVTLQHVRALLRCYNNRDLAIALVRDLKDLPLEDAAVAIGIVSEAFHKEPEAKVVRKAVKPKRTKRRTTSAEWDQIFKDLDKGLTAKEVAAEIGIDSSDVYRLAKRHKYKIKRVRRKSK